MATTKTTTRAKRTTTKPTTKPTTRKATTRKATPKVPHPGVEWLALMEAADLSQTKAATQMGVAPMTLNRLVNGHGIPTAKVTVAFATVVGADVKELWQHVADYELALAQR